MYKIAIACLALAPLRTLTAQSRKLELGLGVLSAKFVSVTDASEGDFAVGGQQVALGVFLSPVVAIEPALQASFYQSSETTASSIAFRLGVPFYLAHSWGHSGTFVEPQLSLIRNKYTSGVSTSQFSVGIGVGNKLQLSNTISVRLEAVLAHTGEARALGVVTAPSYVSVSGFGGIAIFFK